ncbi:hypothetical protein HHO41_15560 [Bacillus sp. DNRA2]|uniref:hypothetical protein n=1 Tax=Bacillus sp. DNRA2 TaxID=2723053 RepID=UPI00145D5AA6|nr:hypothetical protein [Bacillus sp. DNRA2]NMD71717.1 hypothetical protein [Bacillus sp. DNRA2]
MLLRDEVNLAINFEMGTEQLIEVLNRIKSNKEAEIVSIKEKIIKYEEKRRTEDAMYRSLSPIKKLFTSRAPSHHQAVEYMVYVKERFKSIEKIKRVISGLNQLIVQIETEPAQAEILVSGHLLDEIKSLEGSGGSLS